MYEWERCIWTTHMSSLKAFQALCISVRDREGKRDALWIVGILPMCLTQETPELLLCPLFPSLWQICATNDQDDISWKAKWLIWIYHNPEERTEGLLLSLVGERTLLTLLVFFLLKYRNSTWMYRFPPDTVYVYLRQSRNRTKGSRFHRSHCLIMFLQSTIAFCRSCFNTTYTIK